MTKKAKGTVESGLFKGAEVYDDTDEQEEDWVEEDQPQPAPAQVQQTEAQITEPPPPEDADLMPTAVYNANLNQQLAENAGEPAPEPEQLAEQDRKADAERTEQLAKEAETAPTAPTAPTASTAPDPAGPHLDPLPSNDELHGMRRSELDELAAARGVDVSSASNKDEVIDLLRKDARKRKKED